MQVRRNEELREDVEGCALVDAPDAFQGKDVGVGREAWSMVPMMTVPVAASTIWNTQRHRTESVSQASQKNGGPARGNSSAVKSQEVTPHGFW